MLVFNRNGCRMSVFCQHRTDIEIRNTLLQIAGTEFFLQQQLRSLSLLLCDSLQYFQFS